MKPENEVTMEFISRSCNEAFSRAAVGAFIAAMDPTLEELSDIKTAVSEAVTNCMPIRKTRGRSSFPAGSSRSESWKSQCGIRGLGSRM